MANPGVGTKFVSVNLNKSYGQTHHHHHHHHSSHSNSYGSNRTRPGGHGVGGGMVVLSRPRSSQKPGPKLSVPPPLNLPSLRKEHERLDSLGSGTGPTGGGVLGNGQRPTSAGMGWTKPRTNDLPEKEGPSATIVDKIDPSLRSVDGVSGGSSVYMPPSARAGMTGPVVSTSASSHVHATVEKSPVLRGEDFPSLQATLPSAAAPSQKQRDGLSSKLKHGSEGSYEEQRDTTHLSSRIDDRSKYQSSQKSVRSENAKNGNSFSSGTFQSPESSRKQEDIFPGPLPLVSMNPRSDWADDERDTSHGLIDRVRDRGHPKSEAYWERDFDMPRVSSLPHKPTHNFSQRWNLRDDESGKFHSSDIHKVDPYGRDARVASREGWEGNFRKNNPVPKDGFGSDNANDRNAIAGRPTSVDRETNADNTHVSHFREHANKDGRRDTGFGQNGRQTWNSATESYSSQEPDRTVKDKYGSEQHNRFRGETHNTSVANSSYSSGLKRIPADEPLLNFGRDRRSYAKIEKPYMEDPFMKDFGASSFDGRDPFTAGLVGVVKRKKDVIKQTDFHDPVRESFEAELERVQQIQEQERQRIIEEQERALELARREEEERQRLAREHEERQRRAEEEAREAAWRAEQERLEAIQKAEELRIAREEEKQRIFLEEERRKQGAKLKLLELEEKIAKRQAEAVKSSTSNSDIPEKKIPSVVKDVSRLVDTVDWEDGEKMVERITTSASSESSSINRSSEDQSTGYNGPRREVSTGGRVSSRKEFYGGAAFTTSKTSHRRGITEPQSDEYSLRGQRPNLSGGVDHYNKTQEFDSDFQDNVENFGDHGWRQESGHNNFYFPYPERVNPISETDGSYSVGRSRYSQRQPRVLPPPSVASMQKSSVRNEYESVSRDIVESEIQYDHPASNISTAQTMYIHHENRALPEIIDVNLENGENEEQKPDGNTTLRCDSQSTLSVFSPPTSPTHLSHEDLDDSGDSPVLSASREGTLSIEDNESAVPAAKAGKEIMITSTRVSTGDEDEWGAVDEHVQEQEEYDEDDDGYQEEDEVHEGEDENIDLVQDFDDLHLDDKGSPHMLDNLVLGFNEGVEVGMPNDEFERIPGNEENLYVTSEISNDIREEQGSSKGLQVDGNVCQYVDASSQIRIDPEEMQDLVLQSKTAQALAESEITEQGNSSCRSSVSVQQPISSSVSMAPQSISGQVIVPSAVSGQAEPPVKLQFGLFSGPSLIPSPVPAIQIGSIQMPLHLHPQITQSMTHMHSSQPPLFQFGQLRYTSSVSPGVLPLAPQPLTFVPPTVQTGFSLKKNPGDGLSIHPSQETCAHSSRKNNVSPFLMDNQQGLVSRSLNVNPSGESESLPLAESIESKVVTPHDQTAVSCIDESNSRPEPGFQAEHHRLRVSSSDNRYVVSRGKESEGRAPDGMGSFDSVSRNKGLSGLKGRGQFPGGRGKKYIFTVKNSGSRLPFPVSESTRLETGGFQRRPRRNITRTEFRVRETADKKLSNSQVSSNHVGVDDKPTVSGRTAVNSARNGTRKVIVSNKPSKRALESEGLSSGVSTSVELDAGNRSEKGVKKEYSGKSQGSQYSGEGNFRRNICSGEDVDAPLQSGIIRVFEQPGIEAPSDEDDFIEVRSKRQMLNDRREQREKEIKAKSHNSKIPRKGRSTSKSALSSVNSSKVYAPKEAETVKRTRSDFVAADGGVRGSGNVVVSSAFSPPVVSQPLAPIGTPALKSDSQSERSHTARSIQTSGPTLATNDGRNLDSSMMFDKKDDILDNVQSSFTSWGNSRINQQVIALTQTQLDEAMKPAQFDLHPPAGDTNVPSPSILAMDRSFSSAANPISSLLAGEKIQFGAVTSPTVLPPGSCSTLLGIGAPTGLCHSDIPIPHKLSGADNDCHLFFEKEKHRSESCTHIEDSEAEAEAAASAVAVAAISSDEMVTNGIGTCSVSVTDTNNFGGGDINVATGSTGDQQLASKTRADDSLTVALPADLSVETPPISLWPTLPSPQNSSSQMLSHFPGGSPSQFPFYEINPMLGGPVFTFGPHDESVPTTQAQTQKSSAPAPGPLGSWKQCHSGVDSFYGPPTGFTGPFISPGGIPGVQGPPHMVVYNHFAPVGQFGQVGLSFMGATYIPSGKQHDWKHSPGPSSLGVDGDQKNLNMVSAQRMPTNLPPIQHLAPGSPLLPMASPLAMFDVSPFQASPEMSVQTRWPSSASPVQPVPLSMPMQQQQAEGILPSHFSHASSSDPTFSVNRFSGSQPSVASDLKRNFTVSADATVTQLPDELGIVDSSSCVSSGASVPNGDINSLSVTDAGKAGVQNCSSSSNSGQNNAGTSLKSQSHHKGITSAQQYSHSSGYNYQRSGASQKNSSGGSDWTHRRTGFMGRTQSGAEKNFSSAKMKQIYVAKQPSNGNLRV
ncbi:uncharacterized protein LOC101218305 isoform X2 [Cucumis sativus]|uniref:uncharacterized protein LOC101218305 isoform X2 n=1 Tax=Cucumis sativus TaxID=3659 RepID=UPI0012F51567|nr:uncharacterized protein LOC101218305 isoform X2 [Cucumis sativus]KAE8647498.1 hypothetical protein Csa_003329 [Cucumis sativus]